MKQPPGFEVKDQEQKVCRLKQSIYGLRQSLRCWNFALDGMLKEMGFQQTSSDPCLYVNTSGEFFIIAVYWASEASPTLGCSIEISRDIYMCLSYVKSRGIT